MISRSRITLAWLGASVLVLGAIAAVVLLSWYPPPYFRIEGADRVLWFMVAAQLVLGPLLVLILYKPGKKGLWLDMTVIVALQLGALGWGLYTLQQDRPRFMVFAVDRFNLLAARDIDLSEARKHGFESRDKAGPLLIVARMPTDPKERDKLLDATMFRGEPDIDRRPVYWEPYASGLPSVIAGARTVEQLNRTNPELKDVIQGKLNALLRTANQVFLVPVRGVHADFAIVIDRTSGDVLDAVEITTWF